MNGIWPTLTIKTGSDFWERGDFRNFVPCRRPPRTTPPAAPSRPSARSGPSALRGIALRFNEPFMPLVDDKFGTVVIVRPAALQKSFDFVMSDRRRLPLLFDHERPPITFAPDGFRLAMDADGLYVEIVSLIAIRAIRGSGRRSLSIGLSIKECIKHGRGFGRIAEITRAVIDEISVVRDPACAGCKLFF